MPQINLVLRPIPPVTDPCKSKETEDRPFTQQEIARALADLLDFIAEQEVFAVNMNFVEHLNEAPISPITE